MVKQDKSSNPKNGKLLEMWGVSTEMSGFRLPALFALFSLLGQIEGQYM